MSRWRQDPDGAAAELLRRSIAGLHLAGHCLLANAGPATREVLRAHGIAASAWSRRAGDLEDATPWPAGGPYDVALLRLAKAKDEQEMSLHAVLGVLAPAGRLILYGGNDEGIRSGIAMLESVCGGAETLSTRGHGRIVAARRPEHVAGLRGALADWRRVVPLPIGGVERAWVGYPGVFAASRLDEGTALMLTALPGLGPAARVLDYGCGSGVIAGAMRARLPDAQLEMLDSDSVALLAAAENVPAARTILGVRMAAAGAVRYDAILSNPPLHAGIAEDHRTLGHLIADAPRHLKAGGLLQLVVQRRVPLETLLAERYAEPTVVAENGTFRVWRAKAKAAARPQR